ncbi:hypothetical protein [Paenibacillus ihumii]|uniref:hypothetical protein n=1 Tax=Paenibacillus ihumii TaxID=687436 RepID=UPI0006D7C4BB|nr:hypothetical protein [Paenibacillus ihumii]
MKGMRIFLIVCLSILILLVGGCKSKEELKREEEIRVKAEQVGVNHFKEKYNVDVVFTRYDIMPSYISSTIYFEGHIKGEKDKEIDIFISYITYEVSSAGIPKEYMNSQRVEDEASSNTSELPSD